jgi:phosphoglycolate phosphatase-like HAD superfamily hydrolase
MSIKLVIFDLDGLLMKVKNVGLGTPEDLAYFIENNK